MIAPTACDCFGRLPLRSVLDHGVCSGNTILPSRLREVICSSRDVVRSELIRPLGLAPILETGLRSCDTRKRAIGSHNQADEPVRHCTALMEITDNRQVRVGLLVPILQSQ